MMTNKNLIFIGGTMGIGKTTLGKYLVENELDNAVFLDGDWCWYMNPWNFSEENKKMVLKNIQYLLNSFLKNSELENIVFVWVMHQQQIIDDVLSELHGNFNFFSFSLVSSEEELSKRFSKDIDAGVRDLEALPASIDRLKQYENINSIKIDVTDSSLKINAGKIINYINQSNDDIQR